MKGGSTPWPSTSVWEARLDRAKQLLADWLAELGFSGDPEMDQTPHRFTELMRGFVPQGDPPVPSTFPADGSGPVVLRDVPFHSLCVHHLLPFFGSATIAYRPWDRVAGFSSIAGVVGYWAQRPQLQERMAEQVADNLFQALEPQGLVVRLVARQLCMEMRGVRASGEAEVLAFRADAADLVPLARS